MKRLYPKLTAKEEKHFRVVAEYYVSQGARRNMSDVLKPQVSLLVKLGSIAVHAEEILTPDRHEFDVVATQALLDDPEVKAWVSNMDALALLPKKRR